MPTYISDIIFTAYLKPEAKMPVTDTITTEASNLTTHGNTLNTAYVETDEKWRAIDASVTFPDEAILVNAFTTNTEALGSAVVESLDGVSTALSTFASSVSTFRTGTYDPLKKDVDAFNALPDYEYSAAEKEEAAKPDSKVTIPAGATKTAAARAALITRLEGAESTYKGYVDTCVTSIKGAVPTAFPLDGHKPVMEGIELIKKSYNLATTWIGRGANLRKFKGRLGFLWKADAATMSNFLKEGVPGWMKVHDPDSWLGKFLPDSFKSRIPNFDEMEKWKHIKNFDKKYAQFLDGMEGLGRHYWLATLSMLPTEWTTSLSNRINSWVKINSKFNPETGKLDMKWVINPDNKMAPGKNPILSKLDNMQALVEKFEKSPLMKGLDKAGKFLGPLDTGLTYYNSYTEGYNEALRENPDFTPEQARTEAIATAAFEGTGEAVGSVVGGVVGRSAGAAIGQVLIPIPGVGAAAGGFVGGIIGEAAGGYLGKKVGSFLNDVRTDGFTTAFNNTAGAVGGAVKEAGSALLGGAKKLFGWG